MNNISHFCVWNPLLETKYFHVCKCMYFLIIDTNKSLQCVNIRILSEAKSMKIIEIIQHHTKLKKQKGYAKHTQLFIMIIYKDSPWGLKPAFMSPRINTAIIWFCTLCCNDRIYVDVYIIKFYLLSRTIFLWGRKA